MKNYLYGPARAAGESPSMTGRTSKAEATLKLKTNVFELGILKYRNLSELARAMGMSVSHIYRVKQEKRRISEKFIVGAMKAFPEYGLADLFTLVPEDGQLTTRGQETESKSADCGPIAGTVIKPLTRV